MVRWEFYPSIQFLGGDELATAHNVLNMSLCVFRLPSAMLAFTVSRSSLNPLLPTIVALKSDPVGGFDRIKPE